MAYNDGKEAATRAKLTELNKALKFAIALDTKRKTEKFKEEIDIIINTLEMQKKMIEISLHWQASLKPYGWHDACNNTMIY